MRYVGRVTSNYPLNVNVVVFATSFTRSGAPGAKYVGKTTTAGGDAAMCFDPIHE